MTATNNYKAPRFRFTGPVTKKMSAKMFQITEVQIMEIKLNSLLVTCRGERQLLEVRMLMKDCKHLIMGSKERIDTLKGKVIGWPFSGHNARTVQHRSTLSRSFWRKFEKK